ncbi:MAG: hypothetical protein UY62_C0005G0003 [Parcubacteria group bacterium GW2011_GWF2_50_9]|nr:MAG: hypothetical protein UY62_C0005G0003 [Parcubacteria group bacterium GW2011_GWF2_50_9]
MAVKRIFNSAGQFQANVENANMDVSSMPVKLGMTYPVTIADDFNDGVKDPLWKEVPQGETAFEQLFNVAALNRFFEANGISHAQAFTYARAKNVTRVTLPLRRFGTFVSGENLLVEIRTATAYSLPTSTILGTSQPVAASSVPTTEGAVNFTFSTPVALQANIPYAIVLRATWASHSYPNVIQWGAQMTSPLSPYSSGRPSYYHSGTSTWNYIWELVGMDLKDLIDFHFQLWGTSPPGTADPPETGGYLEFDYPSETSPKNIETVRNSALNSMECETRFLFNRYGAAATPSSAKWGFGILQANPIPATLPIANKNAILLWELLISTSPGNSTVYFTPVVAAAGGQEWTWNGSIWVAFNRASPTLLFPVNTVSMAFTLYVTQGELGTVSFKLIKNDDPAQVVMQTTDSPVVRTLSGSKFLDIGNSDQMFASKFRFDYFKLAGTAVEADTGHVTLRHVFQQKHNVTGFTLDRTLPAPGSRVNVRVRAGDTLAELQGKSFGDPVTTATAGSKETGQLSLPASYIFETQLEFIKASPGPTLNSFDFPSAMAAVDDDLPIILSLDEAGPGLVMATSSEEGLVETANTKKLVDGDAASQWGSLNASDASPVTLQLTFISPSGGNELRNVDAVILRNTNLKSLRMFVGGTTLFDGEILDDDVIIPFAPQSTPVMQIEARTTKTANQNKKIGEVYCGRLLAVLPGFDKYEPRRMLTASGEFRTLGGKLISFRGKNKYSARWTVSLIEQLDKDALEKIFTDNPVITFWPEPKYRPRDLFDAAWRLEALPFPYTDVVKDSGHTIDCEMEEI